MQDLKMLKILYLEDMPEDAELVERMLKKDGFEIALTRVDSRPEFVNALRHHHYDVILSDHALPQFNSSEALKICKRVGIQTPFILVTGAVSEEFAVECLRQGANDYILKSNLTRLPTAIVNSIRQSKLEQERKHSELVLHQQNRELHKINQELDNFVYSVSHNLRAPLMSILGLLNVAKSDTKTRDGVYDEYFAMMEISIHKLDKTIKEILDYSRNARNELAISPVNFEALIDEAVEKLKYMDGYEKIKTQVVIKGEHISFYSDSNRIMVVLENLISNAIKYRDDKKEQCKLSCRVMITEENAELIFEDNGIGIDNAVVDNIFKMFYRGTDKSSGAGLGLYIVKEVLEKLNGKTEVTSAVGVGTQFKILLPNAKPI